MNTIITTKPKVQCSICEIYEDCITKECVCAVISYIPGMTSKNE